MIEHVWSVVSEQPIVDRDSGRVSLINIFDTIKVGSEAEPIEAQLSKVREQGKLGILVATRACVTTYWARSDRTVEEKGIQRVVFRDPSGAEISTTDIPIEIKTGTGAHVFARLEGFPIRGPGSYSFDILLVRADGSAEKQVTARIFVELTDSTVGLSSAP